MFMLVGTFHWKRSAFVCFCIVYKMTFVVTCEIGSCSVTVMSSSLHSLLKYVVISCACIYVLSTAVSSETLDEFDTVCVLPSNVRCRVPNCCFEDHHIW